MDREKKGEDKNQCVVNADGVDGKRKKRQEARWKVKKGKRGGRMGGARQEGRKEREMEGKRKEDKEEDWLRKKGERQDR